jgi:glutamate dehydrogenase
MTKDKEIFLESTSLSSPLIQGTQIEVKKFQEYYLWLEKAMPHVFFEEVSHENLLLITHSLMGFDLQDYFSTINRKNAAIVLCLESPDADLRILRQYSSYGIKNYQAYISKEPAPFKGITIHLRIATIDFTEAAEANEKLFPLTSQIETRNLLKKENEAITDQQFEQLLSKMNTRFLLSVSSERLALAIHMLFRASTRDSCQYEVRYEENWEEKEAASMCIVLAWRNTPKYNFLYSLAQVIYRHGLSMKRVNATYASSYSKQSVLVMVLHLHGSDGQAVWDVVDIPDFLRELSTFKYFDKEDQIKKNLVDPRIITGNMGSLLRAMIVFVHQVLVQIDSNLYTIENVEEAFCRHPELTVQLCEVFKLRFDPNYHHLEKFLEAKEKLLRDIERLDTGQESYDIRRKTVLSQGLNFIKYTLKTNFFRFRYIAMSFRLDPTYLDHIPFDRSKKFPDLPYAIFFIQGLDFFGFHIRFKDLARGGIRTIYPQQVEQMVSERNYVFSECYSLAWTQHKKNKDIPEGGAKAVLFLYPFFQIDTESYIFNKELEWLKIEPQEISRRLYKFREEQKEEYLYQSQRAFIDSLLTIVNCDVNGKIRARFIVDYWKKPEYIYLGPDENMHDGMIEWIANFSQKYHYKPGSTFISSKPHTGINHKEYGVTSFGIHVYMVRVLEYLGIQAEQENFTVKMTGGPDGDVAGNQILNLHRFCRHTARLIALTDGTGTIKDEQGLNLDILKELFGRRQGICFYPPEELSDGGFLIDKRQKRYPSAYMQETLCWRKLDGVIVEDWLSGSETNHLLHANVHQTKTDIFIPAGGRPRTLNETNITEFLDDKGIPTAKAIIEGANLYLNSKARQFLESKGVLIFKDSSANKGGVICSSFEVLCGLALSDEKFMHYKSAFISEILERIKQCAYYEADLLLRTHKKTGEPLTLLSDQLSDRINQYTYQLLDYLDLLPFPLSLQDPMTRCFLNYCLPTLQTQATLELLKEIPEHHKKAIIACHLASYMVYKKGIDWSPSIVDILPLILSGTSLTN